MRIEMQGRRKGQRKSNSSEIRKNVIRCNYFKRVVWEHEICDNFNAEVNSTTEKNCKNCKYSF